MQFPLWFLWLLVLLMVIILLALWQLLARVGRVMRNVRTPFSNRRDLETAYQNGSITWDEYDRWRDLLR